MDAAPEFIAAGFGIVVAVGGFHDVPISPVGLGHVREDAKLAGVSCSRRYKPFSRARRGRGNTPSGKHSRPNERTRHDKGGNICNDAPAFILVFLSLTFT